MVNIKFDQSKLVSDVLSLRADFCLSGPDASGVEQTGECCLEDYRWLLVDRLQGDERIVAKWQDQMWVGVQDVT